MNVLLVHPDSPFLTDSAVFPPLGVLYLAAALEANGHRVQVTDLGMSQSGWWETPDFIGISCATAHYSQISQLIQGLRGRVPSAPIMVGGPHFSVRPEDAVAVGADCVGVGDCERAIVNAVHDAERGELKLRYSSPGGIVDVDEHPIPARHLLPVREYKYTVAGLPATSMVTARGCCYGCLYCCKWEGYRTVRMRAISNVIEEVRQIKSMGFQAIQIYDDELNLIHQRTLLLCKALKDEGIRWRAFVRSNLFNREQARAMADSGCYELCTGVESGSDEMLRRINKRATTAHAERMRALCHEHGIRFKGFFILGLPGETDSDVALTRDWILRNQPDDFDLSVFTPYPGSPLASNGDRAEMFHKGRPGQYGGKLGELRDSLDREIRAELGLEQRC